MVNLKTEVHVETRRALRWGKNTTLALPCGKFLGARTPESTERSRIMSAAGCRKIPLIKEVRAYVVEGKEGDQGADCARPAPLEDMGAKDDVHMETRPAPL